MRKKLALLLAFIFAFTMFSQVLVTAEPVNTRFIDTAGHWAEEEILEWAEKGVIFGNAGYFKPDASITRAEFCAIINRIFGFSEASETNFTDVDPEKWYANDVAIAKNAGYVVGYGNNLFGPEDSIIKQDASRILYTVFNFDGSEEKTSFSDDSDISAYAKKAVSYLSSKGYIQGKNNRFYPKDKLTRAEFIDIIDNIVDELYNAEGTYSKTEASGNVVVRTGNVVLKDMVIEGNLYLAPGIGEGNVTLNNVTVNGATFANGGGENSIIIENSTLVTLVVMKVDGKIRIVARENTSIENAQVYSGAILESDSETGGTFENVEILQVLEAGQSITLDGDFASVSVEAPGITLNIPDGTVENLNLAESAEGANINISEGATVGTLVAGASANVSGQGAINNAEINAANVVIEQNPGKITISEGITANIGGKVVDNKSVSSGSSQSGGSTPTPPKSLWTLVWSDEFNGSSVDTSKWSLVDQGGGFGNEEQQYYSPANATVEDGKLIITAKKEKHPNATYEEYTSAKLVSNYSKKYGKIEARIKLPLGTGLWPAFWMMPQDSIYGGWAASGEVDIMEARGRVPDVVCGTLHYGAGWPNNVYSGKDYIFPDGQTINEFHTYAIEWEPGEIRWYVDGVHYQTQNNWYTVGSDGLEKYSFPAPFDQEFYLQLNLAIGGTFDGGVKPDDSLFDSPVTMEVDYVRVYELTGRPYKEPVEPIITAEPLPAGAKQPDDTGNLVSDINFENGIKDNQEGIDDDFGEGWNYVHNDTFNGVANVTVEEIDGTNYAKVDVINKGSQPYSVQLEQLTTLGKGRWYRFSFDAKADKNRTLNTKLGGGPNAPSGGWTAYSGSYTVNLTTEFQNYSFEFQMTKESDIKTRIEFNCATDTGPVWIGNVRLEEIDPPVVDYNAEKEPLADGNHIHNGAFDKYTIDRMACWNVAKTDAAATVSVPESTRELTARISNGGSNAGSLIVYQQGLKLVKDNNYKLTFKARADQARSIKAAFTDSEGNSYLSEQEIALTTNMQTHEITFTMTADTDTNSYLKFLLGGNNADVYIDDVRLTRETIYIDPSVVLFPLKNGDFSSPTQDPWLTMGVEGGAADFALIDGEMKVTTTNLGANPWNIMVIQSGMNFSGGVEYLVEFDARSTVERDIEVIIEDSSYTRYFDEVVSLTPEMQRFGFSFRMPASKTVDLKFLLGKIAGAVLSDIYIDNVVCEVKDARQYVNLLENGTFADGTNGWLIFNADWEGASGVPSVENGVLAVDIGYVGSANWSIQVEQENLTIESDKSYVLTFDISSDVERDIQVTVEHKGEPYTKYLDVQTIHLTSETKTYSFKFMGPAVTDTGAHLTFMLGNVSGTVDPHTVYISNVSLIENPFGFTPPPPPESHGLLNGTFDTDTEYWEVYRADGSNAEISVEDGKMKVHFPNYDGWFIYSTQVYQQNISLEANKTYTLSFEISATIEKQIIVSIEKATDYNIKYLDAQNITVTTGDAVTYSYDFTMGDVSEENAKLVFQLGSMNVPGESFISHSIYIDNVTLVEKEPDVIPGVNIIPDGSFDDGLGAWDSWWGDECSGGPTSGDAIVADGLLKVIVDSIGTVSYNPQVFRPGLTLVNGVTYDVSFKAKADKAWGINVNIGKPLDTDPWFIVYAPGRTFNLNTELEEYSFEFTVTENTCDEIKIVFEVGKIGDNVAPVVIYFDDVSIKAQED